MDRNMNPKMADSSAYKPYLGDGNKGIHGDPS